MPIRARVRKGAQFVPFERAHLEDFLSRKSDSKRGVHWPYYVLEGGEIAFEEIGGHHLHLLTTIPTDRVRYEGALHRELGKGGAVLHRLVPMSEATKKHPDRTMRAQVERLLNSHAGRDLTYGELSYNTTPKPEPQTRP